MLKSLKLSNLVAKVRDVMALDEEEEIIEEEEEEEGHDEVAKDDSDLDLDLPLDGDVAHQESSESAALYPYYQAVGKLNGLFPTRDFKKHPSQLPQAIREMQSDIENLTIEQENLRKLSDVLREINSKRRGIDENESSLKAVRAKQQALEHTLQNLEMVNTTIEDSSMDLESAEKKMVAVQTLLQSCLSDNEQVRREIARLEGQLAKCRDQDADMLRDLEDEKEAYNQLVKQLNTFQAEAQGAGVEDGEQDVTKLEEEVASANAEWERLRATQTPKDEVERIEAELAELTDQYKRLVDDKDKPQDVVRDDKDSIRNEITELLVKYFSGEKSAIEELKQKFGWSDEQIAAVNEERGGLTGIIKQGARLFTGFRDAWTSWLIAASED